MPRVQGTVKSVKALTAVVNDPASLAVPASAARDSWHGSWATAGSIVVHVSYRNAHDTRSRNRRQKTGVGFWRRFFTPVAKFLAPETNTDE